MQLNAECERAGIKVTMLAFLVKAVVAALKTFPEFNASLQGKELVLKKYFHIGFAVDTPDGLIVPVLHNANAMGLIDIAQTLAERAELARAGKLKLADMEGGCFSISSLGGVKGTGFTPIINAPEIAILGAGRAQIQPRWNGQTFEPRKILPLALSWDHRVTDGAAAGRFLAYIAALLQDLRRTLL